MDHLKTFTLPGGSKDGAAIDLVHLSGPSLYRSGDFSFALTGSGFEANRYLTREELTSLRDWITYALTA